jgi:crotonobetaine/carnitine-CoA ligase
VGQCVPTPEGYPQPTGIYPVGFAPEMNWAEQMSDFKVPEREECVLRYVLERRARLHPERPFIRLGSGGIISYGEFKLSVERTAAGLAALGVGQGDTVTVWLPNSVEMIRIWFAINWLGAVFVPINTGYRGNVLSHVLANAASRLMIASVDLVDRLRDIDEDNLETVVVVGGDAADVPGLACLAADVLDGDPAAIAPLGRPIEPWDAQSIIYTSGTTGRSKGVLSSYAHLFDMSGTDALYMLDADDCFLLYAPLFHVGGTLAAVGMLNRGASIGVVGDFSTEAFWPAVRATGATFIMLVGVMSNFITSRPPSPDDRNHTLKKIMMIPLPNDWRSFAERFGMTVWTLFNMTEVNTPLVSEPSPALPGTCGKARRNVELRVVDENDREVPFGSVGELVLRSHAPWALNSGYFKDAEATNRAWRNGWFHTGDAFRRDEEGNYFFVDRKKDAIRRRGENISSFEVETEILAYPGVQECAVVAVPNELSEDDVLAIVAPVSGYDIDPADLFKFLAPRLAHFMLPRFIRIVSELPHTPTQKIQKHILRDAGVTADTWDREKEGIRVIRERIRG